MVFDGVGLNYIYDSLDPHAVLMYSVCPCVVCVPFRVYTCLGTWRWPCVAPLSGPSVGVVDRKKGENIGGVI